MLCYQLLFLLTLVQLYRVEAQYTLTVKTGLSWGAGTDALVKIRLGAESGNWSEIIPLQNNRNNFEHGGTDLFTLPSAYMGAICHLTVWMTNKGGLFVDWQLDQIILHDSVTSGDSVFNFNKWMRQEENASAVINGGWGQWSPWSQCSRLCGGGLRVRTRSCDRPPPGCEGKGCTGSIKQKKPCAEEECTTTISTTEATTTTTTEETTTTTEVTTTTTTEMTTTTTEMTTESTNTTPQKVTESSTTIPTVYANAGRGRKKKPAVRFSITLPPLIMTSLPETTSPFSPSSKYSSSVTPSPVTLQRLFSSRPTRHSFISTPESTKFSTTYFAKRRTQVGLTATAVPTKLTTAARTWWVPDTRQWHRPTAAATPRVRWPYDPYTTTPRRHRYHWRQRRPRPTHYRHRTTYRPFLRLPVEHRNPYPRCRTTTLTTPTKTSTLTSYSNRYSSVTNPPKRNWREQTTKETPPTSTNPVRPTMDASIRITSQKTRTSEVSKPTVISSTTTSSSPPSTRRDNGYPKIERVRTSVATSKYLSNDKSFPDQDVTRLSSQSSLANLDVTIRSRIIQKDSATQDHNPPTRSNQHDPVRTVRESSRPVLPVYVIVLICISAVVVISVVIVSVYCAIIKSKVGQVAVSSPANVTLQSAVPVQSNSFPMTVQCVQR